MRDFKIDPENLFRSGYSGSPMRVPADAQEPKHRHGWDCFRRSGGYTNAFEQDRTLAERIETVYKTAYRTGYKNGHKDGTAGVESELKAGKAT